jgi:hypothetical protein
LAGSVVVVEEAFRVRYASDTGWEAGAVLAAQEHGGRRLRIEIAWLEVRSARDAVDVFVRRLLVRSGRRERLPLTFRESRLSLHGRRGYAQTALGALDKR